MAAEEPYGEGETPGRVPPVEGSTPARPRRKLPPRRPDQLPRGRHGLSPDEVEASQRTRILDAMKSLAGERGYHDASIADVIKRAGVTRKAFYKLFDDKEQCFIQAYERDLARVLTLTLEAFETQDEWADRVRDMVKDAEFPTQLRKKVIGASGHDPITTIHGVGYRCD